MLNTRIVSIVAVSAALFGCAAPRTGAATASAAKTPNDAKAQAPDLQARNQEVHATAAVFMPPHK
jgi:hypothetical protein